MSSDPEALLSEIRGHWDEDDPPLLALDMDKDPVVADVDGELRVFHSGLVYPSVVDEADVLAAVEEHGATVERLGYLPHAKRYSKGMFEWEVPEDDST